jgi:hypothetical protein
VQGGDDRYQRRPEGARPVATGVSEREVDVVVVVVVERATSVWRAVQWSCMSWSGKGIARVEAKQGQDIQPCCSKA